MKVIPCPHEKRLIHSCTKRMPNHHPLTREEIAGLLDEAKGSVNPLRSQIQGRLYQGIVGFTCPSPIRGPMFEKEKEICRLYLENLRIEKGSNPDLVEALYAIMVR